MVLFIPLISSSPSFFSSLLRNFTKAQTTIGITCSASLSTLCQEASKSFRFLLFYLYGPLQRKNPLDDIFIIIIPGKFFTTFLAGSFSQEFEGQQVSSGLQGSS